MLKFYDKKNIIVFKSKKIKKNQYQNRTLSWLSDRFQAQIMVLMTKGIGILKLQKIFLRIDLCTPELGRMGAKINNNKL